MPVLIDAYNLMHVTGVLPPELAGPDLEGLIDLLAASRHRNAAITLYCDGDRPPQRIDPPVNMRLRFSGPGRTADELMIDAIRRSDAPRNTTVVTSDREILQAARRRRCPSIRSEAFMRQLASDHAAGIAARITQHKPKSAIGGLDSDQVHRWIRRFGLTPDDLVEPAADPPPPADPPPSDSNDEPMPEQATEESPPPADAIPDDVMNEAEALAAADAPPSPPEPANDASADSAESPSNPPDTLQPNSEPRRSPPVLPFDQQLFPPGLLDEVDRIIEEDH